MTNKQHIIDELHHQLGQAIAERDWLKKSQVVSLNQRKTLLDSDADSFSLRKQCELLGINRSSLYYPPKDIDPQDITLMHLLDKQSTKTPFYGVRRMMAYLRTQSMVNVKQVRRLLRLMGLKTLYQLTNETEEVFQNRLLQFILADFFKAVCTGNMKKIARSFAVIAKNNEHSFNEPVQAFFESLTKTKFIGQNYTAMLGIGRDTIYKQK